MTIRISPLWSATACLTFVSAMGLCSAGAHASVAPTPILDISLSYEVSTTIDSPVEYVITFNRYADGSTGSWWPSSVGALGGTINDPFQKSSDNRPLSGLLLGLTSNLPGDAPGQQHVVLMEDSGSASALQNVAWGTTFSTYLEGTIASDIHNVAGVTRGADGTPEAAAWDAALNELYTFAGDASSGAGSLWFPISATSPGETKTSNFVVTAWSDGQQIGTGVASITQAVPEPTTYAMGLAGLAVIAGALRFKDQRKR